MKPHLAAALLVWSVTALVDAGMTAEPDEVSRRVGDGTLFRWLETSHGVRVGADAERVLLEQFGNLDDAVNAGRKFGVRRNGLVLLQAWCVELLQQSLPTS